MKRVGERLALPRPGNSLAEKYPAIAAQWHLRRNGSITPDMIGYAADTHYWWICEDCGHEWKARPANRSKQIYLCPKCKRHRVNE
jgi:rubrerythrin